MSPRGPIRPLRSTPVSTPKVEIKPEETTEDLLPTTPVEPEVVPPVEEPKVEEPKVEEPRVEEPKVEEPKVEEPKEEEPKVEPVKVESLGKLGGKRILSVGKQEANGKIYNKITCEDKTTYLLTDHDVEEQVEK